MAGRKLTTPQRRMAERADLCYAIYLGLGADRSLRAVRELLGAGGVKIADSTLEKYSAQFGWQERLESDTTAAQAAAMAAAGDSLQEIDRRHQQVGRTMQQIGLAWMRSAVTVEQDAEGRDVTRLTADVPANAAAAFLEKGSRLERLAAGLATDRSEIAHRFALFVAEQIVVVFRRANSLPTEAERARAFALGTDNVIEGFLTSVARGDV